VLLVAPPSHPPIQVKLLPAGPVTPDTPEVPEVPEVPDPVPPVMVTVTKFPVALTDWTPDPVKLIPVAPAVTCPVAPKIATDEPVPPAAPGLDPVKKEAE